MAIWNPWRGCKKCSEGCLYCYIHKGDLKRGIDTSLILKTKDYKTILRKICEDKEAVFILTTGNDKNRYVAKEDLYNVAKEYLDENNIYKKEFEEAVKFAQAQFSDRAILIVGSFYVYKKVNC